MIVKCNAEKTVMHFSLECSDLLQGNLFFFMAASVYDHVYLSKRASATFKVFEAVFQKTSNLIMIISSYQLITLSKLCFLPQRLTQGRRNVTQLPD